MKTLYKLLIVGLAVLFLSSAIYAKEETIRKTFDAKETVRIKTVSGDCFIKKGSSNHITVEVTYSVRPQGSFEPEFYERGNTLKLQERWYGSSSGRVTWEITVPANTEIEFSTASGDLTVAELTKSIEASTASGNLTIEKCDADYDLSTASGDISFEDSQGDFDLSTASGDIECFNVDGFFDLSTASGSIDISDSRGEFDLSCASGSVRALNVEIEEESNFSTASGRVEVRLAKSAEFDLDLSSASGSVTLDYNGNTIKGYFEFTARKRRGRINSPIKFEDEEEFERHGQTYVRKSFSKGGKSPRIFLETASGKVTLKK